MKVNKLFGMNMKMAEFEFSTDSSEADRLAHIGCWFSDNEPGGTIYSWYPGINEEDEELIVVTIVYSV